MAQLRLAKLVSSGGSLLEAAFREHNFRVGDICAGEFYERDLTQESFAKAVVI
jgi:hypothetical protein